jgi:hypothetical protein
LEAHVEVAAEALRPAVPEVEPVVAEVPGFEGGEAEARDVGLGEEVGDELAEVGVAAILAVAAGVDASEDGFLAALGGELLNLGKDRAEGAAAGLATGDGGEAEAAGEVAAVLDFDEGAGGVEDEGVEGEAGVGAVVGAEGEAIEAEAFGSEGGEVFFGGAGDDEVGIGEVAGADFAVAAGDDDGRRGGICGQRRW